jgi:putative endonuclease
MAGLAQRSLRLRELLFFCTINMPGSENSTVLMFFYVYVLQSLKNPSLYIGYTHDLRKRLEKHNRRLNFSTKSGAPWKLIFYEAYINEEDAKRREKYLKTSQGSRLLKRMLKEYFYQEKFN